MHPSRAKRLMDVLFATAALILTAPLWILIAIAVKMDSKGSIFFVQSRAGENGRIFPLIKFRSLIASADSVGAILEQDDSRITRVGKILRPLGLDELPQLTNIVLGQMSFVGPRPALPDQALHYSDFQRKRLQVKPGLTSLVAVSGGHLLSWKQRIRLDVWYVRHWSLGLDFAVMLRTLPYLFFGRALYNQKGINEEFLPVER